MRGLDLIQAGLCDAVKLFIKTEPHKQEKLETGRYRLISNVSLVDQVVERLLNSPINKAEIEWWDQCPSKPGIGFDEVGQRVVKMWLHKRLGEPVYESDVSGFDWSVHGEWLLWDAEFRAGQYTGPAEVLEFLRSALFIRAHCVAAKTFLCSDGMLCDMPECYGVQASGSYNTSSTNSRVRVAMRAMLDVVAGDTGRWSAVTSVERSSPFSLGHYNPIIAMGDDALEMGGEALKEEDPYGKLGIRVTLKGGVVTPLKEFEFCSFNWCAKRGVWAYPVGWAKSVMRLSGGPVADIEIRCGAVINELRHCPGGVHEYVEGVLRRLGWYVGKVPTGFQECEAS